MTIIFIKPMPPYLLAQKATFSGDVGDARARALIKAGYAVEVKEDLPERKPMQSKMVKSNMLTRLDVIAPPQTQPVSLATVKQFARVDDDADDTVIQSLINTATDLAQQYLNRAIGTQTLQWSLARTMIQQGIPTLYLPYGFLSPPWFPWSAWGNQWSIELPRAPVQQIISVSHGFWGQTPDTFLTPDQYNVDYLSCPARLQVTGGAVAMPDHLTVQMVCGWDMVNTIQTYGTATAAGNLTLLVANTAVSVPVNVGDTPLTVSTALQATIAASPLLPSANVLTPSMVQLRGAYVAATVGIVPAGLTVTAGAPASEIPAAVTNAITMGATYLYQNLADPDTRMPGWFYRGLDPYRLITFA